ncbi:hydrolase [Halococcus dombrowskii]|uniref:Hydrolase n=1 Tax=Halococcus dombrowskii TaxID=179637 RepID=A0AAV3SHG4_HALDO|nr:hydrolase [Halococcus dombrowskii]UOO95232.1 hydrolase [Halococcus dombrowskii]
MIPNDRLEIHFLNVDHGDCSIIRHPGDEHRSKGRISFVDINDWKDKQSEDYAEGIAGLEESMSDLKAKQSGQHRFSSKGQISEDEYAEKYLDNPVEYFQSEVSEMNQNIWRFICTHPDMDHISGLDRLCTKESISVFWDINHNKDLSDRGYWPPKYDKVDWDQYSDIRSGNTSHQYLQPNRNSQKQYWENDNIEILHPSTPFINELNDEYADVDEPKYNDGSYVLKSNTRAGAILLPGDVEKEAWDELLDYWGDEMFEDVRILKASHHGRKSGFHEEAVSTMDPEYVIVSVGTKPTTDAHQDYYRTCSDDTKIWSTRQYGTISFTIGNRGAVIPSRAEPDGIFDLPGA